jgi:hypothetical protein
MVKKKSGLFKRHIPFKPHHDVLQLRYNVRQVGNNPWPFWPFWPYWPLWPLYVLLAPLADSTVLTFLFFLYKELLNEQYG